MDGLPNARPARCRGDSRADVLAGYIYPAQRYSKAFFSSHPMPPMRAGGAACVPSGSGNFSLKALAFGGCYIG